MISLVIKILIDELFAAEDLGVQCERRHNNWRPKGVFSFYQLNKSDISSIEEEKNMFSGLGINKAGYKGNNVFFVCFILYCFFFSFRSLWTTSVTPGQHRMLFSMWEQAGEIFKEEKKLELIAKFLKKKKTQIDCKIWICKFQVSQWEGDPDPIPGWRRRQATRSQTKHIFTIFTNNSFTISPKHVLQLSSKLSFTIFTWTCFHNFHPQSK